MLDHLAYSVYPILSPFKFSNNGGNRILSFSDLKQIATNLSTLSAAGHHQSPNRHNFLLRNIISDKGNLSDKQSADKQQDMTKKTQRFSNCQRCLHQANERGSDGRQLKNQPTLIKKSHQQLLSKRVEHASQVLSRASVS